MLQLTLNHCWFSWLFGADLSTSRCLNQSHGPMTYQCLTNPKLAKMLNSIYQMQNIIWAWQLVSIWIGRKQYESHRHAILRSLTWQTRLHVLHSWMYIIYARQLFQGRYKSQTPLVPPMLCGYECSDKVWLSIYTKDTEQQPGFYGSIPYLQIPAFGCGMGEIGCVIASATSNRTSVWLKN